MTTTPAHTAAADSWRDTSTLLDAYQLMCTIRATEERILQLRREEHIAGSVHVCVGHEAVPAGVARILRDQDRVIATYRGHGWALACGVGPRALLAEALGRATGTNGGRGGSPYLSAPEYRFLGENSIVGAGLPVANGVAMAAQYHGDGGVAVVSFGDGATNQGAAHEALVFAVARKLPVIFVCENNEWSEMTPIAETVPGTTLAARAAAYGMPAACIDGTDVEDVSVAAAEAAARARAGDGPTFLEFRIPRILGHYNGDVEHYRSENDKRRHAERDPLPVTRARLLAAGNTEAELAGREQAAQQAVAKAAATALDDPLADPQTARLHVAAAAAIGQAADPGPSAKLMPYGLAVNLALRTELERRPEALVFGEDVAVPGGTFGVTRNLRKQFGDRVFDTPISETAILGAALGTSLRGMRPVVEIMWMDFLYVAADQLINQAANVRYVSQGRQSAPLVVRMQQGATPGSCAQHSQSLEAILAHIPGLKVGLPATPHDAYMMVRAAVADPDPVILIEARALYQQTGPVDVAAPPQSAGGARLRRRGRDVGIITWSTMVDACLEAAGQLAEEGIEAAVLDLRWLRPLDYDAVGRLVQDTGKILIVHEANRTGGFGAEVAAVIADRHFTELGAPIRRVAAPDIRVPAAPHLQASLLPDSMLVVQAAQELHRNW